MDKTAPYIRLILTDVDGTLTDGSVTVHTDGSTSRTFNTMDGHGVWLAQEAGVPVILMSKSKEPEIMHRAVHLGCEYYLGIDNKAYAVKEIAELKGIDLPDVCFLGNDVMDLAAMDWVGYPGCTNDAHPLVRHFITNKKHAFLSSMKGGEGALRDLVDHLMLHTWHGIRWGYTLVT